MANILGYVLIFSLRFHTSRNFQKASFIKFALPSVFDKRSFFAGGNFDTRPTLPALPPRAKQTLFAKTAPKCLHFSEFVIEYYHCHADMAELADA